MSVSELQDELAEARESLHTIRASSRKASLVRLLGVVVGLVIVLLYLWAYWSLALSLAQSEDLKTQFEQQFEQLQIGQNLQMVFKETGPTFREELLKLIEEMGLQETISNELNAFAEDVQPIAREQFNRVAPQLTGALQMAAQDVLAELRTELRELLEDRLTGMIREHETMIAEQAQLSEDDLRLVVSKIIEANHLALFNVLEKRWGEGKQDFEEILALIEQFPPLPDDKTEEQIVDQSVKVLLALMKEQLPTYKFEAGWRIPGAGE